MTSGRNRERNPGSNIPSQILMFIEINDGIYNFQAGKTCRMLNTYSGWLDHILQHDKHVLIGAGDPRGQPAAGYRPLRWSKTILPGVSR